MAAFTKEIPLFGETLDWANRLPAVAVFVVRAVAAPNEAEVPRVTAVRARDGRPVAAVRTGIDERKPFGGAGAGEEDAVRGVVAPTTHDITFYTILRRPRPVAFILKVRQLLYSRHTPSPTPMHMRGVMLRREIVIRRNPSFIP